MLLLLGLLVIIPMIIEQEILVESKNEGRFVTAILTVEYDYKVFLSEMRLLWLLKIIHLCMIIPW